MSIFYEKSYKSALRNALLAKKATLSGDEWSFSILAERCRIQKTYLSRVFNGTAHLNLDQLFLALEFLALPDEERQFVELLHHWERSEIPKRRRQLEEIINEIRRRHTKTERHLSDTNNLASTRGADAYYLDPNTQLVHLFLTVPKYAEAPMQLAKKLGLTDETFKGILNTLQELGLITVTAKRLKVLQERLHLPTESNWIKPYQLLVRLKGLERLQNGDVKSNYAYSLIFSANDTVRSEIQAKFFGFLKEIEGLIRPAKNEKVYQLQFDLVDWDAN